MRRHKLAGLFFCLLALWVQVLAPVAAATLVAADPLAGAVICSHDAGTNDGGAPQAPASAHHHCLLCQVCVGGGLVPERPAFTALDYPAASPLRWLRVAEAPGTARAQRPGQPRGPPVLV